MLKIIKYFFFISGVFLLSSCGYIPMEESRDQYDIQIVKLEDRVTLIIPSDLVFYPGTANLKENYTYPLRAIVKYLKANQVPYLQVAAYENDPVQSNQNETVAQNQVKAVVAYLHAHYSDGAMISSDDHDDKRPLSQDSKSKKNRRIELSFKLD